MEEMAQLFGDDVDAHEVLRKQQNEEKDIEETEKIDNDHVGQ